MIKKRHKYCDIEITKLITLPQVRKIKNSRINELADSILVNGLINPINVAKLNFEEFQAHINFINRLWKKNIRIEDYTSNDGFYHVVIAGHSRLEALKMLKEQEIEIKLHDVKTSEEILAIQLDENIHKEIRLEERAIAIIEMYYLGLEKGKWQDKSEFIIQNQGKFSKGIISDALAFSDLPSEIQDYVFKNNTPFAIGVELGKLYSLVEKYERELSGSDEKTDQNIRLHYAMLMIRLQQTKSIKKGLAVLSAHGKLLQDFFRPKEVVQQELFDWWNDGVNKQGEMRYHQLETEYNKLFKALNGMPFEYFEELLSLDSSLTGINHSIDIQHLRKLYDNYINERFLGGKSSRQKM